MDTILGVEIFPVVHMKTKEEIYVSLEDIKNLCKKSINRTHSEIKGRFPIFWDMTKKIEDPANQAGSGEQDP